MRRILLALLLCVCPPLYGQGIAIHDNVTTAATNVPSGAQAPVYTVPFAQVTVCDSTCSNPVPIYSDVALTQLITQPLLADAQGRFSYYIAPGSYFEQLATPTGQVLATIPVELQGMVGQLVSSPSLSQTVTQPAGTTLNVNSLNNVLYVHPAPGADVGPQIVSAATSALCVQGCTVSVPSGSYTASPATLSIPGVSIVGAGAGNTTITAMFGASGNLFTLAAPNQSMTGMSLVGVSGLTSLVSVSADGSTVRSAQFQPNGATYGVLASGNHTVVSSNTFTTNASAYVYFAGGSDQTLDENIFNGAGYTGIGQVAVFNGVSGCSASLNTLNDTGGFGIQTLLGTNNCAFTGNRFYQPMISQSLSSTAGQTVFSFTLPSAVARTGVQVGGAPAAATITTSDNIHFSVVLASGANANQQVSLLGFRSLENFNINSNSSDITISGNTMDGTGDSGIVLGSDYHNGTLNPSASVLSDYPTRISVVGNVIKHAAFSGVAETSPLQNVTITGNTITDCAELTGSSPVVYSSGIFASGPFISIHGNTINSTQTPGLMGEGIAVQTGNIETGSPDKPVKIGGNIITGTYAQGPIWIPTGTIGYRASGIDLQDASPISYPEQPNTDQPWSGDLPSTNYFSYTLEAGATGFNRDTTNVMGGTASILINYGYFDIDLTSTRSLGNAILRADFWALVHSGTMQAQLTSSIANTSTPVSIYVQAPTWQHYSLYLSTRDLDLSVPIALRFGGSGIANIQNITFSYTPTGAQPAATNIIGASSVDAPAAVRATSVATLGNVTTGSNFVFGLTGAYINTSNGVPSGSCVTGSLDLNTAGITGTILYACIASAWVDVK